MKPLRRAAILLLTAVCLPATVSFAQFSILWTQTSDTSAGADMAYAITADASGIYAAGYDNGPGNPQWRIEKRDLSTGALLWTYNSNPSAGDDRIQAITADAGGVYAVGYDNSPGNPQWRIEKHSLSTGALIWTQTNDPGAGSDMAYAITVNASEVYVAGYDSSPGNPQWIIEKRNLSTGALIWTFNSNPSAGDDRIQAITADASGVYAAGYDNSPGNPQWRIRKHDLNSGFSIWTQTNNPSVGADMAYAITADAGGVYVAGYDSSPGNEQWRIEKRSLSGGALLWTQTSDPSVGSDMAYAITADAGGVYVAGYDNSPGNPQWRIEKRDPGTGALLCTQISEPSIGDDRIQAITADAGGIYVAGHDESPGSGNAQWRIEKYDLCGGVVTVEPRSFTAGDFFIYPAVNNGIFNVHYPAFNNQLSTIEVYNALGQKVYYSTLDRKPETVNLSALGRGIYFVKINIEERLSGAKFAYGKQYVQKIIINY